MLRYYIKRSFTSDADQGNVILQEVKPSTTVGGIQEDSRSDFGSEYIHSDRINQVGETNLDITNADCSDSEPDQSPHVIKAAEQFIEKSRKEGRALKIHADGLSHMRSGNLIARRFSKKQQSYLQSIPKDTINAYLAERKQDLRPFTEVLTRMVWLLRVIHPRNSESG
jgi:hypothetical protein